ncbi:hypothetical protein [Paenibacillus sp. SN-8-1]|uniref:hypothetical protein n=1 Tax=Paenibacillus sp. SN-8-1 TaxID=3435409 RepID=UPI003D9A9CE6
MTVRSELDIDINTTSLNNFLSHVFKDYIESNQLEPDFKKSDKKIIGELNSFGLKTLSDLNNLITKHELGLYVEQSQNFIGLLRNIMLIIDSEKYFKRAWKKNWNWMETSYVKFLKTKIPNIEQILEKYKVDLVDDDGLLISFGEDDEYNEDDEEIA